MSPVGYDPPAPSGRMAHRQMGPALANHLSPSFKSFLQCTKPASSIAVQVWDFRDLGSMPASTTAILLQGV